MQVVVYEKKDFYSYSIIGSMINNVQYILKPLPKKENGQGFS
jgi:hypothetical protein